MTIITINGNSLDTESLAHGAFNLVPETAKDSNYILIQTDGPLTKEIKEQLKKEEVDIQERVSENTYLCGYKPETQPKGIGRIGDLPYITFAQIYPPHCVIDARLKGVPAASSSTSPLLPTPDRSKRTVTVDVEFHKDVVPGPELIKELAATARLDPESLKTAGDKARITIQHRYLADVAELDQVKRINEVHPVKLYNDVARGILRVAQAVHPASPATRYEGDGELVCVADTGFDQGSLDPAQVHKAFITPGPGAAPVARIQRLYALGRPNNASDPDGHGTHVCGSVAGDGTYASTGAHIQGTAPRARLVVQSTLDSGGGLGGIPADLRELFAAPYKDEKVRIHTNSWGAHPAPFRQIEYNNDSKAIDDFVYNKRDMVILFAAGNDGMDTKPNDGIVDNAQVGAEAAAKNCISVGASESYRPDFPIRYASFGFPKQPLGADKVANDVRGMAAFSSRGPTREGRIKPDVVAPGTCILSARSSRVHRVLPDWGISTGDDTYMYDGGTSMATPLVAGCCAVLREALVKNGTPEPSAALIKALLINGAVELAGQYVPTEAGRSPNNSSGWGLVDVANSIVIGTPTEDNIVAAANMSAGFRDEAEPLDTGETFEFTIPTGDTGRTLKITLVWTDPPGGELQNDLDLIVVAPGDEIKRHGNQPGDFPYNMQTHFDRKNNVEQIVWERIPQGSAKGQSFALVWKVSN
ncbi:peptidase S8/S53 domain-containing protein [Chaetomium strumarium]|uniref:Peptidase S8/S53 domain-containing protein n=1 Tax=Chaetomium strumarium TaxID=1170767 RepID=A0AAJ0H4D6_9PEZI|nr:peptidase S8/S53 domain-containing protein [Chaetomium strumarium]